MDTPNPTKSQNSSTKIIIIIVVIVIIVILIGIILYFFLSRRSNTITNPDTITPPNTVANNLTIPLSIPIEPILQDNSNFIVSNIPFSDAILGLEGPEGHYRFANIDLLRERISFSTSATIKYSYDVESDRLYRIPLTTGLIEPVALHKIVIYQNRSNQNIVMLANTQKEFLGYSDHDQSYKWTLAGSSINTDHPILKLHLLKPTYR